MPIRPTPASSSTRVSSISKSITSGSRVRARRLQIYAGRPSPAASSRRAPLTMSPANAPASSKALRAPSSRIPHPEIRTAHRYAGCLHDEAESIQPVFSDPHRCTLHPEKISSCVALIRSYLQEVQLIHPEVLEHIVSGKGLCLRRREHVGNLLVGCEPGRLQVKTGGYAQYMLWRSHRSSRGFPKTDAAFFVLPG